MVQSRRRTSLLGMLALIVGAAALVLTKFNPTGIEIVPNLPVTLRLSTAAAIAATGLGLIAFLAAASSARTGAGLPFVALLVGTVALLLGWQPNLLTMIHHSAPAGKTCTGSVRPRLPRNRRHRKNPSIESRRFSTLTSRHRSRSPAKNTNMHPVPPDSSNAAAASAAAAARIDGAAAIRAARAKLEAARGAVKQSIESSPVYRNAKDDDDAAETALQNARLTYDPGSSELIAASRAALAARSKLEDLISAAAAHDAAYQDAQRQLQAAQSSR